MPIAMNGRAGPSLTWLPQGDFRATARSHNTPPKYGTRNHVRCHEGKPPMTISPLPGKPAPKEMLVDLAPLERQYFECRPDLDDPEQPARGWRLQVQSDTWRAGRYRRHPMGREPGQRTSAERQHRRKTDRVRGGPQCGHDAPAGFRVPLCPGSAQCRRIGDPAFSSWN
jgi:hypothetical protein